MTILSTLEALRKAENKEGKKHGRYLRREFSYGSLSNKGLPRPNTKQETYG